MFLSKYPHDRILNVNYASFGESYLDGFFQESKETTFGTHWIEFLLPRSSCHVNSLFETAAIFASTASPQIFFRRQSDSSLIVGRIIHPRSGLRAVSMDSFVSCEPTGAPYIHHSKLFFFDHV